MEMTTNFILAQVFGALAAAALIAGVQFKKKEHILILMITNSVFFTVNFILLGAWSGAIICAVGAVISLVIYLIEKFGHKVSKPVIAIFAIVELGCWALGYQSPWDIFPLVGTFFWLASMLQRDENRLRWLLMVNYVMWIVYGVATMAYTSILADVFSIVSTVIALIRYREVKNVKTAHHQR